MLGSIVLQFPMMATKRGDPAFPNRIRELRNARVLTIDQLAKAVGLSKSFLAKIETGDRELTVAWMERIAPHLGVSAADLLPLEKGGLSDKERRIVATYREIPESMRASIEAVAESQQPFRGAGEVVPLGDHEAPRKTA